jgi:hypothetical protein
VVDESQVKAVPRTAVKAEKAHKHATAN